MLLLSGIATEVFFQMLSTCFCSTWILPLGHFPWLQYMKGLLAQDSAFALLLGLFLVGCTFCWWVSNHCEFLFQVRVGWWTSCFFHRLFHWYRHPKRDCWITVWQSHSFFEYNQWPGKSESTISSHLGFSLFHIWELFLLLPKILHFLGFLDKA